MTEEVKTFEETVLKSYPTGSRFICNPPPTNTDNDTVFLVNGYYDYASFLLDDGWEDCGIEYEMPGTFRAFRKGEENYICIEDEEMFNKYVAATDGAKALNLLNKEDRIKLFEGVLNSYGGYQGMMHFVKFNRIDDGAAVQPVAWPPEALNQIAANHAHPDARAREIAAAEGFHWNMLEERWVGQVQAMEPVPNIEVRWDQELGRFVRV